MAKAIMGASWILVSMFIIVLATDVSGQTILNFFNSVSNQTQDLFNKISEPIGNYTKDIIANHTEFIDYVSNGISDTWNRTGERVKDIYEPVANRTKDFIANHTEIIDTVSDGISNTWNRTGEIVKDIYKPVANHTMDFINNVPDDVHNFWEHNNETIKNCSIVVGIALAAGGVIGPLAVGLGIPLVLCLLGFTCWGIMAGSAAACCQSSIGDVPKGSCFACCQSTGAGGGMIYIYFSCIVGAVFGIALGGYIADTYFHCFSLLFK